MKKGAWREERLMAALRANGRVTVGEAVKMLGVSEATARRLFSALEATGQVIRNYGGIQMPSWDGYSFEQYEKVLESEKRRIGIAASALVEQGDSLYLDCGTTLLQMAEALRARIGAGEIGSLNIVTNSIANLGVLADAPLCRVILLGGEYNHARRDFSGPVTERCLEQFHFKKCFLGSEGLSAQAGLSTNHPGLSSLSEKVMAQADQRIALVDSSKFGVDALVSYAPLGAIDVVVTDAWPRAALEEALESEEVKVIIASDEAFNDQPKEERKEFLQ